MARGCPSKKAHLWFPFQRARRALADAAGAANPLGGRRATAGPRSACCRLRRQHPSARKSRRWCRCALRGSQRKAHCQARSNMPRSGALAAAAGPKGKGSGGAMQGRPLRCQHGRRWSQSGRGWQGYILWHLRGCQSAPGSKSDRAAPSWRGWVAQKSAAHHAMVPMQLHKHCHSRDLAARIPAIYFALH